MKTIKFSENKVDEIVNEELTTTSQITGGQSAGLNITGDDWAREIMSLEQKAFSKRRNPSRPGPMSAMKEIKEKPRGPDRFPNLVLVVTQGMVNWLLSLVEQGLNIRWPIVIWPRNLFVYLHKRFVD